MQLVNINDDLHKSRLQQILFYSNTERIIINFPGYLGTLEGYNHKYEKIAERLIKRNTFAVILFF